MQREIGEELDFCSGCSGSLGGLETGEWHDLIPRVCVFQSTVPIPSVVRLPITTKLGSAFRAASSNWCSEQIIALSKVMWVNGKMEDFTAGQVSIGCLSPEALCLIVDERERGLFKCHCRKTQCGTVMFSILLTE